MSWTKEKPTAAGWYWYRDPAAHDENRVGPLPICVSIRRPWDQKPGTQDLQVEVPFMDYQCRLEDFPGEWFGPMEPPPASPAIRIRICLQTMNRGGENRLVFDVVKALGIRYETAQMHTVADQVHLINVDPASLPENLPAFMEKF